MPAARYARQLDGSDALDSRRQYEVLDESHEAMEVLMIPRP